MTTHLIIKHQVKDYDTWKPHFDAHKGAQEESGLKLLYLLQDKENRNDITVHFEAKDLDKAKEFINSQDLRHTMQTAGVIGKPEILFLQDAIKN